MTSSVSPAAEHWYLAGVSPCTFASSIATCSGMYLPFVVLFIVLTLIAWKRLVMFFPMSVGVVITYPVDPT